MGSHLTHRFPIGHLLIDHPSLTVLSWGRGGKLELKFTLKLKISTHFEIYSCFTEVISMKDQLAVTLGTQGPERVYGASGGSSRM